MGEPLNVVSAGLTARADHLRRVPMERGPQSIKSFQAPCEINFSQTAADNIRACADGLFQYEAAGAAQVDRLAGALTSAANAYDAVDDGVAAAIKAGTGGQIPTVTVQNPPPSSTSAPAGMNSPLGPLDDGAGHNVIQTETDLGTGDQGRSLRDIKDLCDVKVSQLRVSADAINLQGAQWDGTAAEAASAKFDLMRGWLEKLSSAWQQLGEEANRIADVHVAARSAHSDVAAWYVWAKAVLVAIVASGSDEWGGFTLAQIEQKMRELQTESEEIRHKYARDAKMKAITLDPPPDGAIDSGSSGGRQPGNDGPPAGKGGDQTQQGGGGTPSEGSSQPSVSPASADQKSAAKPQTGSPSGGGAPSGGSPAGGSPAGAGGSPAGGAPTGGMPAGLGGKPNLPKLPEPSLKPAGLHGGGGGGAGGGGGGGMPKTPLGPAVGAETVSPTPAAASGGPNAGGPPAGGAGTGGMGGGMGGGGMGHGSGQQGKEKRRDPNLSPDEDLYKEDRAWTEPVIGRQNPPRRRKEDGKESS
jgi:hypothetical protein